MNFIKLPEHSHSGDFYACNDGEIYRADNLDIATKIAFNNWLSGFDRLYQSCRLTNIEPGRFMVEINSHSTGSGAVISTRSKKFSVQYAGPSNMFEANYKAHASASEGIARHIDVMRDAASAGNPNVRLSKGRSNSGNTGLPLFTCRFPRFRKNGDWWPSESMHLAYDDETLASEQMKFAGLIKEVAE